MKAIMPAVLAASFLIPGDGQILAQATKPRRASPTLLGTPGAPRSAPDTATAVQPQAARPAPARAATAEAGRMSITPWDEEEDQDVWLRRFTLMLDSTVVTLVDVFRNTSGAAQAGATAPAAIGSRERSRWTRCRDLHFDLMSYGTAIREAQETLPESPAVQRSAAALDSALAAAQATGECDNVASMLEAPDRWTPWGEHYRAAARRFYANWYVQLRSVQERNRAFIMALNGVLEAGSRIRVPPAIPGNPPYAGAVVR